MTRETEANVLDVYRRVNPSARPIETDAGLFQSLKATREDLFHHRLKLPLKLFKGASLLSLGAGTGEYEVFYALWGAQRMTCVEMNPVATHRLQMLFNHFDVAPALERVHTNSYFDVDLHGAKYDFVITDGTIVHTDEPKEAISRFAPHVAEGGFLVVGAQEIFGGIQRNLQRFILYQLGGADEAKIIEYARMLFGVHIQRSVKFGNRSEEAIIYDSYVNPKINSLSLQTVFEVFEEHQLVYYSSYPSLGPSALTNSFRGPLTQIQQTLMHPLMLPYQIAWMLSDGPDEELVSGYFLEWQRGLEAMSRFASQLNNVSPANADLDLLAAAQLSLGDFLATDFLGPERRFYGQRLAEFHNDMTLLLKLLRSKQVDATMVSMFKRLFRGSCGVGHMYITGSRTAIQGSRGANSLEQEDDATKTAQR